MEGKEAECEILPTKGNINQELQTTRSEALFCRKCVRYFSSKSEFSHHVEEHIKETNGGKTSYMAYIEKYICSSCGEQFEVKSDLIIHYNTVCFDAPYTCKHCRENCENSPFLQMHLLFHHNYSEDMLRDEGFLTDMDNNHISVSSFTKYPRHKAFKCPSPEDELYSIDNYELPKASSSDSKTRCVGRKSENLAFNLLDKAYTCAICSESFSRKCVLDIHVQKHGLKIKRENNEDQDFLDKSLIMKPCENYCILGAKTIQTSKKIDDTEILGQNSTSTRAILKPCNVIIGSSAWKKVHPKGRFRSVISSASTGKGINKIEILNNFKDKGQCFNNIKDTSRPSNEVSGLSAWKKIKLRSKIPTFAVSEEQESIENSKSKTKLRNKTQNISAYDKPNGPESPKNKIKRRTKKRNVSAHDKQKNIEILNIGIKSESSKTMQQQHVSKNVEKHIYSCEMCKRQFQDNYKLKRHFLTHTGERPFSCSKCNKSFARVDHMKRHLKKVCSKTAKSK